MCTRKMYSLCIQESGGCTVKLTDLPDESLGLIIQSEKRVLHKCISRRTYIKSIGIMDVGRSTASCGDRHALGTNGKFALVNC
jgi:hypothetical protein